MKNYSEYYDTSEPAPYTDVRDALIECVEERDKLAGALRDLTRWAVLQSLGCGLTRADAIVCGVEQWPREDKGLISDCLTALGSAQPRIPGPPAAYTLQNENCEK